MINASLATPGSHPAKHAAPVDAEDDLKTLPMTEVRKRLDSSPDSLTGAEAAERLTKYGPNEIVETKTNPLLKFLMYFWGPIPWMIEVAVVLSAVGHRRKRAGPVTQDRCSLPRVRKREQASETTHSGPAAVGDLRPAAIARLSATA